MKKEYLIAAFIAIFVLFLSNLPYVVPYLTKKDNLIFLARGRINSEDTYTYISTIEQARQSRILFENQYTSESQKPALLRPSYILIGNIARLLHISSINAYNLFRIIFSITFCFVLYKFLHLFFDESKKRLIAFTIILTSGGLGFILNTINHNWLVNSIDLWVPEAFAFLSFSEAPHFMLSLTLLLVGYYFFIKFLKSKSTNLLVPMFFAFFALSFEHPFDLVVAVPVLFFTALWNKVSLSKSFGIAFFSGIGLIYQFVATLNNPILKAWNAQNALYSPAPINYLYGFGILIVFTLISLEIFVIEKKLEQKFILLWLGINTLLLYFPVNFQRRFVEGIQIALAIAAVYGIVKVFNFKKFLSNRFNVFVIVILLVMASGSVIKITWDFQRYNQDNSESPYYYIKSQNLQAIEWLGQKTNFSDIILCNRYFGNLIPGLIGRKVYFGHQIQTIDFIGKIQKTNSFLLEEDDKKAISFLKENKITHIFLGVDDSMTSYGFKSDEKSYLVKIYDKNGVTIYKVKS